MGIINQDVSKIKDNSKNIMKDIYNLLLNNNKKCQINEKETEIIIDGPEESIEDLIKDSSVTKSIYSQCLIDIVTINNMTYIRQNSK